MDINPLVNDEPHRISLTLVSGSDLDLFLTTLNNALEDPDRTRAFSKTKLGRKVQPLVDAVVYNEYVTPLRSILRIIRKRYSCFAIIEYPYFDLEEWSGYAAFYSRSFMPYKRLCCRLHFFEGKEREGRKLINKLLGGLKQEELEDALKSLKYRGFTVLRPSRNFAVGRTAIEFDSRGPCDAPSSIERHPLETTGTPFCTTDIPNSAHVGGVEFRVVTAPFVQQNPAVGVCATASLWAASQILAGRFGLRKFPYDLITRQAATRGNRPPSAQYNEWKFGEGMTHLEIRDALSYTGASTLIVAPTPGGIGSAQARIRLLAYTFTESNLPVIACCYHGEREGHAVTIVGHLLPSGEGKKDVAETEANYIYPSSGQLPLLAPKRHHCLGAGVRLFLCPQRCLRPL